MPREGGTGRDIGMSDRSIDGAMKVASGSSKVSPPSSPAEPRGGPAVEDPITFEVLHNALRSVVDEMGTLVSTVAFSLVVSEGRDFSGSICNARGDLIATGRHDQP